MDLAVFYDLGVNSASPVTLNAVLKDSKYQIFGFFIKAVIENGR